MFRAGVVKKKKKKRSTCNWHFPFNYLKYGKFSLFVPSLLLYDIFLNYFYFYFIQTFPVLSVSLSLTCSF